MSHNQPSYMQPQYNCNRCGRRLSSPSALCICTGSGNNRPVYSIGINVCRGCGQSYSGNTHCCTKKW